MNKRDAIKIVRQYRGTPAYNDFMKLLEAILNESMKELVIGEDDQMLRAQGVTRKISEVLEGIQRPEGKKVEYKIGNA